MTFLTADETDIIQTAEKELSNFEKLLNGIWTGFYSKLPVIIAAIVVLIIGIFLSKLTVKLMSKAMDKSKLDLTINRFVRSAVKIVLYVLIITVVLTILGVPMTSIITVIGTAGVAIGLALQNSLSNLAGGFLILFSKPFRVGSYIQCSGVEGTVDSISILYTKLLTADNKAIFIPNGTAAGAVVTNYNEMPLRRVDLVFGISYDSDYDAAVRSIENALFPRIWLGFCRKYGCDIHFLLLFRCFFTKSRPAARCNCADLLLTKLHKYYNILVRCISKCLHGFYDRRHGEISPRTKEKCTRKGANKRKVRYEIFNEEIRRRSLRGGNGRFICRLLRKRKHKQRFRQFIIRFRLRCI